MAKKVTVINAISRSSFMQPQNKLRVCGYARVSTDSLTQAESYATQVEFYTQKIQSNPLWEFAGVYADEGITGTKMKGRDNFNAMINACEDGEIDLILTKSITRFARNTVEFIQIIRRLKEIGVGVYFEKEGINTQTETSELMLTILASVAQGESEDISGNNRWAVISRFENGTFIIGTPAYGYRKDEHGNLLIEETEAEIVRSIFESYLNGEGTYVIAKRLNDHKVPTIRGSEKWRDCVVSGILQNPVYEGNILHQKKYTEKKFPFTRKMNYGQENMYLIKDAHPPIITHEEAEAVRNIIEYRNRTLKTSGAQFTNRYLFTGRITCEDCGKHLRRQKVYMGKTYEKIIWTCPSHVDEKERCHMKAIREDILQQAFVRMWNKLYTNQGTVLEPLLKALNELAVSRPDTAEIEKLDNTIQTINEQSRILNQVMQKGYIDAALFMEKNNELIHELSECRKKRAMIMRKQKRTKEIVKTEQLIALLKMEGYQREFKEELFDMTVENIGISLKHEMKFKLVNGLVLTEQEGGGQDAVAYPNRIQSDRWEDPSL